MFFILFITLGLLNMLTLVINVADKRYVSAALNGLIVVGSVYVAGAHI